MKKYILHTLLLLILYMPNMLEANECSQSCKISDAPAPVLTEYLTNLEVIKSNILSELSQSEKDNSSLGSRQQKLENTNRGFLASLSSILSFNDYFWSFDYKISLPITNEIPAQVKRDHDRLERESDILINLLKTSQKRKTSGGIIQDVCSWVSNCNVLDDSAENIITWLIKNNRNIIRLYESSILDKSYLASERDFLIVSSDFESQIQEYYNKDTLGSCSKCEGNTWWNVSETIQDISSENKGYKDGVQSWKDAWSVLRWWVAPKTSQQQQAEILTNYLWTQWISWSQADIVLDNLDRYWEQGVSGSNPLFNSAFYAQSNAKEDIDNFSQTLSEKFEWREKVAIVELATVNAEIKWSENLRDEISSLYQDQLPFAQSQDQASQELQLRILRAHFSLVNSINILQKTQKTAESLCNKQWTWQGNCSYK